MKYSSDWRANDHTQMNLPDPKNPKLDGSLALPRWWATYLNAAIFLLPAFALWMLTVIFIVPKLQQICADAGGQPLPGFLRTVLMVTEHGVLFLFALGAMVALLEWFSEGWVRYRRIFTGVAVFLLNSVILTSLFTTLVTFAMVAPALIRLAK
jgi:hypothetical protein